MKKNKNRADKHGKFHAFVRWLNRPSAPTGRIPEGITTEHQILDELRKMNEVMGKLEKCLSNSNHRNQMCLKTGHWND